MAKHYIEREAAKQELLTWARCINHPERLMTEDAIYVLDTLPAADVAPVRHGRWIDKGEYAICMECCGRSGTQYDGVEPTPLMTQFCPNCGAKMDGGKNDS